MTIYPTWKCAECGKEDICLPAINDCGTPYCSAECYEGLDPFRWFLSFGFLLHDDGLTVVNRRMVEVANFKAPNSGFKREWWKRT